MRILTNLLADKLKGSKYGSDDDINEMVKIFDNRSKRIFRSETETMYIPFGRMSDRDPAYGIVGGKLKLTGYVLFVCIDVFMNLSPQRTEVAELFEPSISAAEKLITKCILASPVKVAVRTD